MDQKFYICKRCGNIIAKVKDAGVPVVCCGEPKPAAFIIVVIVPCTMLNRASISSIP